MQFGDLLQLTSPPTCTLLSHAKCWLYKQSWLQYLLLGAHAWQGLTASANGISTQ